MCKMNISELIRQAVAIENNNFQKVIFNVAVGLKGCGFFDTTDWRKTLEHCFEQTSTQMQIDSTEISDIDSSYEITFSNILAECTSSVAESTQVGKRIKRSSTLLHNSDHLINIRKTLKKSSNLRRDDVKVAKILADLKGANWGQILPSLNAEQKAIKHEGVFERAKQFRGVMKSSEATPSSNSPITICEPGQNKVTKFNFIRKRRYAIYSPSPLRKAIPTSLPEPVSKNVALTTMHTICEPGHIEVSAKRKAISSSVPDIVPVSVPVTQVVANVSDKQKSINTATSDDTFAKVNATLANTPRRRSARNKIQPLAAANKLTERRYSVLFTMIDSLQYQNILSKFNIAVADVNDNYEYAIAERICCSTQFLSAVVSGKPIVSIEWIHKLTEKNRWLNPLKYLLKDDHGEKEYDFDLAATQKMARNKKLFENYGILVTPHIIPADVESVVLSGGGKFLQANLSAESADEILCVSDETDKEMWPKLRQQYPSLKRIINRDGFHKMIFQYTHNINSTDIFYQI